MKMNLGAITQAFLDDSYFGSHISEPLEINEGDCFRWAYVAYLIYGGELISFENRYLAHAFIKIDGKYYDSESPNGVDDWKNLMFFKEDRPSHIFNTCPVTMEEEEFASFWKFSVDELHIVLKSSKEIINTGSATYSI